jgi:type I restriction enzyme, S subunit
MKYGLSEKQLAEIIAILRSFPEIEEAILFGSRAIDTFKEASDVDIALKGERVTAALAAKLKFELEEETYLPFFFDFVAYPTITNEALREHINTKGVVIFRRGWRECNIKDVITLEYGKGLKEYREGIGEYDVFGTNGKIGVTDRFIYDQQSIIIGRKGAYREVHLARKPFFVIDTACYTRNKTDDVGTLFLYYWFKNININEMDSGSAIPSTSRDEVYDLDIQLPPLPEQKAIASLLSSLDDKIDLLHRQNKTLEVMSETLFRQWFVEEAQEDWKEGTIADLIEFNPSRKLAKGAIAPYLEMAALSNTTFCPDGWYDREFSSGTKFINGDTLLARITPCLENGKAAYVTFLEDSQVAWGSTEYIVMRPMGNLHPFFAYSLVRSNDFRDYAEGCMEGSSGRQRVNIDHLKNYEVKLPSQKIINDFNAFADSIVPKLNFNFLQIRSLEKLRDTLLPKLMSGEVRVTV